MASRIITDKGISFRPATKDDRDSIWKFLCEHFMSDEPIYRSLGCARNKTLMDKELRNELHEIGVEKSTSKPNTSVLAVDKQGRIVGCAMGYYHDNTEKRPGDKMLKFVGGFTKILPKQYTQAFACVDMLKKLRLDPFLAMEDHGVRKVFCGEVVCASRSVRRVGLGTELVRQSMECARKAGCDLYLSCGTSSYMQKIFAKLNFQTTARVTYAEEMDKYGNVIINDSGEHTTAEAVIFRL